MWVLQRNLRDVLRKVMLKKLEIAQARFQLLGRLEMNDGKSHLFRLMNIWQRVVNEEALLRGSLDLIEHDLIDLRVRLHKTHCARNDHVIEQIEKVIFPARTRESFC